MNHPQRNIIRGLVLSFGVAVGLISTAGAAWAQEAPTSTSPEDGVAIGEALYVERPAPTRDPANELVADPAPAHASSPAASPASPAPAPAPVASPAPAAAAAPAPVTLAPAVSVTRRASAATSRPARATEVQGVQIERSAAPTADEGEILALTGIDNGPLVALAVALVALGAVLVRAGRPRLTS